MNSRLGVTPTADLSVLLYEPEAGRPLDFLRQAQDKLTLRRTVHVRLGFNSLRMSGCPLASTVSRHQFLNYPA